MGDKDEEGAVYAKCSHGFAAGEATKTFARSASAEDIGRAFATAEKQLAKAGAKSDVAGALEAAAASRTGGASGDGELALAARGASSGDAGACAVADAKLRKPPQCKATCNGKGLSLGGWLPCKCGPLRFATSTCPCFHSCRCL